MRICAQDVCRLMIACHARIDDKQALLEKSNAGVYVDMERIEQMQTCIHRGNALGDCDMWVVFVNLLTFEEPVVDLPELKKMIPCMYTLYEGMRDVQGWTYADTCKLFIVSNTERIQCKFAVPKFIARRLGKMNTELVGKVMEILAEGRYTQSLYQETFHTILSQCTPIDKQMQIAMQGHKELLQSRESAWSMQNHAKSVTRPSILKLVNQLERQRIENGSSNITDDSTVTKITFTDFCRRVRFPNSMSPVVRMRCYLLASMAHLMNFKQYVAEVAPGQVCEAICGCEVGVPEPVDLSRAIVTMSLCAMPFDELKKFRLTCFSGYAAGHLSSLNMTDFLHLYIAAYQKPDIWKTVWREIHLMMSTEIAKDVEKFVRSTPFAVDSFVEIMKTGSAFK